MKIIYTLFVALIITGSLMAQAPQSFKYQAVARNASGEVIANQQVSFQISILQGNESGTAVYTETHADSTNQFGLVTLEIGTGTTTNDFTAIDWGNDTYFIQIEMDASGGTSYTLMGTSQLLSVPYAIYADSAGNTFSGNYIDLANIPDLSGYLSVEVDGDITNELQLISFSNDTLYLSNANYVTLPYDSALWALNNDYVSFNGGIKIGLSSTCNSSTKGTIRYVEANNRVEFCDGEKWVDFAPVLTLSLDKINVSCNGGSDGSIDISISGGNPPYSYDWSNSDTTQYINGLTSGVYSVVVTDSEGYTITESITITESVVLSTTLYGSNVTCNGISNGAVNLTVTGGTSPYAYNWYNSSISEDINNLSAGLYKVTVIDANGCTKKDSITISEPTVLSLSLAGTDITCNGGSDGSIDLTVSGGTSPYTYSWSNGATSEDISNLSANTYTVTVTDNNACSDNISITLTQPTSLSLALSGTNLTCYGDNDGTVNLTVTGGTAPYSYSWSNGSTTEDISGLVADNYTITVTDDNGCINNNNITITQPVSIELTLIGKDEVLSSSDGSVDLTVNNGTEPYTFSWSNGATIEDLNNLSAGTYTITITDADNCIATDEITINNITNYIDFSTGQIPTGWNTSGANWYITSTVGNGDSYSLQSGEYNMDDVATFSFSTTYNSDGKLSFSMKRLEGGGVVAFYIDNDFLMSFEPETDWKEFLVWIPSGNHSFKFETIRTSNSTTGEATFIDNISFLDGDSDLAVGLYYQGGIIFDINTQKTHGLICSSNDLVYDEDYKMTWGCYGNDITSGNGADSESDGAANTSAIITDCLTAGIAARVCNDYSITIFGNTFNDWYLPSKNENDILNPQINTIGNFHDYAYWSSTEYNSNDAWYVAFGSGNYTVTKNAPSHVRAIRAF